MAGTNLYRTPTTRTNNQKFTFSCWFKRSKITSPGYIAINYESANDRGYVVIDSNDKFNVYDKAGGVDRLNISSNFVLRDTNSWYHLLYSVDSTAASNRVKFYINGVNRYNDFTVTTAMSQNSTVGFQQGTTSNGFRVGSQQTGSATFNGLMSHVNFVDGLQLDASAFGETDSTTGEWKIKTSPTVSEYGNNGFFILKDGNSVTDQSGKGNNFGIGGSVGSLTKTEDCPSNVFATWNVLDSHYFWGAAESSWCTNGNTTARTGTSQYSSCTATLGASSGKYYWEFKYDAKSGSDNLWHLGIKSTQDTASTTALGINSTDYAYKAYNGQSMSDNSSSAYGSTYAVGDIIGVALDLDNNKLYFHKNGTYQNSGVPTSGSTGTGAISIAAASTTEFGVYVPAFSWNDGSSYGTNSVNFGNGYFGTTAVSSAGTNASGNGIFEYDVPTGYTALSTKGLNL